VLSIAATNKYLNAEKALLIFGDIAASFMKNSETVL